MQVERVALTTWLRGQQKRWVTRSEQVARRVSTAALSRQGTHTHAFGPREGGLGSADNSVDDGQSGGWSADWCIVWAIETAIRNETRPLQHVVVDCGACACASRAVISPSARFSPFRRQIALLVQLLLAYGASQPDKQALPARHSFVLAGQLDWPNQTRQAGVSHQETNTPCNQVHPRCPK